MIRLRVLGPVELLDASGRTLSAALAQPKRLALLIYLRGAGPSFVRRDTLLALFWPELDEAHARNALSQATRFLRQQLGEPSVVISRGTSELGIDGTKLWCDAAAFREAIRLGRHDDAVALYRGDFLEGFHSGENIDFEQWTQRERQALRSAAANAARAVAAERARDERFTTAVGNARRAVELSDLDERAVRELLLLLDRLGDRAGAVAAYDSFAQRLASEYGAEPAPETRAVIDHIRQRDATSALQPASASTDRIGGLRILREVGQGGMSTVYLAKDDKHDREVAVKVLRADAAMSLPAGAFIDETRIMARLTHPNILPLIDSGAANGRLYLVTPYIGGESLRDRLRREGRLPVSEALRIARQIAGALAHAHRNGCVHRDVKPANILMQDGEPLVADFGIALRTRHGDHSMLPGLSPGTPSYMSPEQAAGEPADERSDVYSLGVLVYEMLAGSPPHVGASKDEIIRKVLTDPIPPVRRTRRDVRRGIEAALAKALARNPAERFASCDDFARALSSDHSPAFPARVRAATRRAWSRLRRPPIAYAAGLIMTALTAWSVVGALGMMGVGPASSLIASGALPATPLILIGPVKPIDVDSAFGSAVSYLVRVGLDESRALRVVITDVSSSKGPRELAMAAGAQAVVEGELRRVGTAFLVGIRLISAKTGAPLTEYTATANTADDIIPATDYALRRMRRRIGEPARSLRRNQPLARSVTHSMEALRLLAQSMRAPDYQTALPLVERAVKADTEFAVGWHRLRNLYSNLGIRPVDRDSAAVRAYRFRGNLSPTNRLRVEEKYYLLVGDRAKAVEVDERVLVSGDSSLPVLSQLGELTLSRRQLAASERYQRAALARAPTAYMFYGNLAATLVEEGRIDDADSLLRVARDLLPASWIIARSQIRLQYHRGQLDAYERMLDSARTSRDSTVRREATAMRRNLALVRGRLGEWSSMRAESNAMNKAAEAALPLADLMEAPLIDFWIRNDTASAVRHFNDAVAERKLTPSQYLEVGSFYAIAGRTDLARGFLTDFQAVSDTAERRRSGYLVHRLRGDITRAEGRIAESLDEIRKGDVREDGPVDGCAICLSASLAATFDHGHMTDSAIAHYERYVETPSNWHLGNDHRLLPRILERLGQLHESRGDRQEAVHYYSQFAELWKAADPELQPRVAEARRRIARLSTGTR